MSGNRPHDLAIIGAGIVGMATALQLSRLAPRARIVVLEAEGRPAAHQTGHNSGVIHSGLYYRPGSLKAVNCVRGREAMVRFCEEHGIRHECCGKLVVATGERDLAPLEELARRGAANGLAGMRRVGRGEIREREPNVTGIRGLWIPETGIVDYREVVEKYVELVRGAGHEVRFNTRVSGLRRSGGELTLETTGGVVRCRALIGCAGLQSDRVARLCGAEPGVRIVPFRGEYYDLAPARRGLVRGLIYPVPDPRFPFLGVHFTRRVDGSVEAGPNAVLAFKREGYGRFSFSPRDALEIAAYPGFWRMSLKYWSTGMGEMVRSFSKRAFLAALRRLMPCLGLDDIARGGAGVRAQALGPEGRLLDDFHILEAERMIHVLNAPSPAATASLAIGAAIAEKAIGNFGLQAGA